MTLRLRAMLCHYKGQRMLFKSGIRRINRMNSSIYYIHICTEYHGIICMHFKRNFVCFKQCYIRHAQINRSVIAWAILNNKLHFSQGSKQAAICYIIWPFIIFGPNVSSIWNRASNSATVFQTTNTGLQRVTKPKATRSHKRLQKTTRAIQSIKVKSQRNKSP